ncbi:MAG: hypothetical protein AAF514_18640, partial [Verrucomicrobiota bacterium]
RLKNLQLPQQLRRSLLSLATQAQSKADSGETALSNLQLELENWFERGIASRKLDEDGAEAVEWLGARARGQSF